jgi:hypothetical protein
MLWCRRSDLNRGPADYESAALPLSYVGWEDLARAEPEAIVKCRGWAERAQGGLGGGKSLSACGQGPYTSWVRQDAPRRPPRPGRGRAAGAPRSGQLHPCGQAPQRRSAQPLEELGSRLASPHLASSHPGPVRASRLRACRRGSRPWLAAQAARWLGVALCPNRDAPAARSRSGRGGAGAALSAPRRLRRSGTGCGSGRRGGVGARKVSTGSSRGAISISGCA